MTLRYNSGHEYGFDLPLDVHKKLDGSCVNGTLNGYIMSIIARFISKKNKNFSEYEGLEAEMLLDIKDKKMKEKGYLEMVISNYFKDKK